MPDEFINYHWIFDAGDDPDVAAVALADLDVHVENALLAPRLRLIAARRSTRLGPAVSSSVPLFPSFGRRHLCAMHIVGSNTA